MSRSISVILAMLAVPLTVGASAPSSPDRDGDGLLDADDDCPSRAENYNNIRDQDGCPEGTQLRERR